MIIKLADEEDYEQIAQMRWLHSYEDDKECNEDNTFGVDKQMYINKVVNFLKEHKEYKIFIGIENEKIISCMFIYLIPKVPNPNGKSEYIAYLTKVYTRKDYRHNGIGTELLNYIKDYLISLKCELIFVWPSDKSANWYKRNGFSEENDIMECILMDK